MSSSFDFLIPKPQKKDDFYSYGTVTNTGPLRVLIDGDVDDVEAVPTTLASLSIGDRVYVTIKDRQLIVLGIVGGIGITTEQISQIVPKKPLAPTSFALYDSNPGDGIPEYPEAYEDSSLGYLARARFIWSPVFVDVDGDPITLKSYEIWGRRVGDTTNRLLYTAGPNDLSAVLDGFKVTDTWEFFVRAVGSVGGLPSDFFPSAGLEVDFPDLLLPVPPIPSTPILSSNSAWSIDVKWDGAFTDALGPTHDFRGIYIYAAEAPFTTTGEVGVSLIGTLMGVEADSITVSRPVGTWYIAFQSFSNAGKKSALSATASAASQSIFETTPQLQDAVDWIDQSGTELDTRLGDIETWQVGADSTIISLNSSAIVSFVDEYALSDSYTVAPTTGWSETTPAWTPGQYIWVRTKSVTGDNTIATGAPALLTGNTGEPGEPGATSYLHIKYSDDGTTFTANNGETPGAYIGTYVDFNATDSTTFSDYTWNLVKGTDGASGVNARAVSLTTPTQAFTYTSAGTTPSPAGPVTITATALNTSGTVYYEFVKDGVSAQNTTANTYSYTPQASFANMPDVMVVNVREGSNSGTILAKDTLTLFGVKPGIDGTDGSDGRGITSAVVAYQNDTDGTTAPTGTWEASPNPVKGQYLWTRTITTYTDASTITTYSVAYVATDGQAGEDGNGIASTTITYQIGSSGTTAPTGTWTASVPAPVQGQYLWTKTFITYTDASTSTAYSTSYYATDGNDGLPGANAFTVYLTNESHTFAAATDGIVSDYAGGVTGVRVYYGTTLLTCPDTTTTAPTVDNTYKVTAIADTTGTITTTPSVASNQYVLTPSAMTTDSASKTLTIVAQIDGTDYTFTKVLSYSKSKVGTTGTAAKVVTLTATTQVLSVPSGGGATTPDTSVVTGTAQGTTISVWQYSVDGGAFSATVPTGVSRAGNVVTITGGTMTAKTIAVLMGDGTVSDTLTVAKVSDGATGSPGSAGVNAFTVFLTNEAHAFAADTAGTITDYTGGISEVRVYYGTTLLTCPDTTTTAPTVDNTYKVTAIANTTGTITTTASVASSQYVLTPSAMTTDFATKTLTIVAQVGGVDTTFTKVLSYSKSKVGSTGTSSTSVVMGNDAQTINALVDGTVDGAQTITIPFTAYIGSTRAAVTAAVTPPTGITVTTNTAGTSGAAGTLVLTVASGSGLVGASGQITINFTANGTTFPKVFSWSKVLSTNTPRVFHGDTTNNAAWNTVPGTQAAPVGSTWFQHQTNISGNVIAQYTKTGTADNAWAKTDITSTAIANLDLGKLTAGAAVIIEGVIEKLWTDVIRSRQITTDMLLVGSGLNLVPNGALDQRTGAGALSNAGFTAWTADADKPEGAQGSFLSTTATTKTSDTFFELEPDTEYKLSAYVKGTLTASFYVKAYNNADTELTDPVFTYTTPDPDTTSRDVTMTASWVKHEWTFTTPATTTKGKIAVTHAAATQRIGNIRLQKKYGASLIVDGGIAARHLNVDDIRSSTATIGMVSAQMLDVDYVDGTTGQRITLLPDGLRLYAENDTGDPSISLTTSDAQSLSILDENDVKVAGMDAAGTVLARTLAIPATYTPAGTSTPVAGSLLYRGTELDTLLWNLPWGRVAYAQKGDHQSGLQEDVEYGVMDITFNVRQGRMYRIWGAVMLYASGTTIKIGFRHATGENTLNISSPQTMELYYGGHPTAYSSYAYNSRFFSKVLGYSDFTSLSGIADGVSLRTLLTVTGDGGGYNVHGGGHSFMVVEDIGPDMAPVTSNYTTAPVTYYRETQRGMEWYNSYDQRVSYGDYNYNNHLLYQGKYSTYGIFKSMIGFPDAMRADLAGATVHWIDVYLYATHWYYGSGGEARIGVHTSDSQPATYTDSGGDYAVSFARGEAKWVRLPSDWYAGFQNGTYKGIVLHAANSTDALYYGTFDAASTQVRYGYTK